MTITAELAYGKRYEAIAAKIYAEKTWPGCIVAPCPAYADVDFTIIDPIKGLLAFLEVKTRRITSEKYESTIVSLRKHHSGRYGLTFFKVKTPCLVLFADTLGVFELSETPDSIAPITRWERGGEGVDHAHYAHSRLTWLPELHQEIMTAVGAAK